VAAVAADAGVSDAHAVRSLPKLCFVEPFREPPPVAWKQSFRDGAPKPELGCQDEREAGLVTYRDEAGDDINPQRQVGRARVIGPREEGANCVSCS
jgi:hypothetical protein